MWLGWVGVGGDGWGWVGDGGLGSVGWVRMGAGRDSCGQEVVSLTFQLDFSLCFESLWMGLGSSWAQIGFRLGTMAPH